MFAILLNKLRSSGDRILNVCDIATTNCAVLSTEYSMFAIMLNKLRSSSDRILNVCDIA